ncbi:MAG TPA: ABC transporter ATP-binding protein [Actinomycetes bacterium]|nr:ABC transporter ATP-binding protein [Actinomycetes bacterium]
MRTTPDPVEPVAQAEGLVKQFRDVRALAGIDLAVRPGEIVGLLGPNGAGKTTTIRLLLGYLKPTEGRVRLLGGDPRDVRLRVRAGYLPGDAVLDRKMTVKALLRWYAGLRGGVPDSTVQELCERLALDPGRRIAELSSGNRRKVGIVQAVMHDPDVLLLDEPTSGLDPLVQREVHALFRERRDRGAGVLLSSHVLPEVEDVADRVVMLRSGSVVHESSVAGLRDVAHERLELELAAAPPPGFLDGVSGVASWTAHDHSVTVQLNGPVGELLKRVAPLDVQRIRTHEQDLEDVFFAYYREDDR